MDSKFQLIAHRGASSLCPENTRSALLKALSIGADCIEIDVRLSKDGTWVVVHDGDLKKISGSRQKIEALNLRDLKQFDFGLWFDREFEGEKILTLEEACEIVLPNSSLILDIKTNGNSEFLASRLRETLSEEKRRKIILSSFSLSLLKACRKIMPDLRLGFLLDDHPGLKTWTACRESFYSVHPRRSTFTPELVQRAHASGLKVFVWTINHLQDMKEVLREGSDGFFTDFPQRAKGL